MGVAAVVAAHGDTGEVCEEGWHGDGKVGGGCGCDRVHVGFAVVVVDGRGEALKVAGQGKLCHGGEGAVRPDGVVGCQDLGGQGLVDLEEGVGGGGGCPGRQQPGVVVVETGAGVGAEAWGKGVSEGPGEGDDVVGLGGAAVGSDAYAAMGDGVVWSTYRSSRYFLLALPL